MPGVSVGAIVEVRMREDHPAPDTLGNGNGHVWLPPRLFPPTDQPHAFCEYILIAPRALDLVVRTRNWRESPADADKSTGQRGMRRNAETARLPAAMQSTNTATTMAKVKWEEPSERAATRFKMV